MKTQVQTWDKSELQRLEDAVNAGEDKSIMARWHSGRYLLHYKRGKQLPNGLRAILKEEYKLPDWDVTARMRIAEECKTEAEVVAVTTTYKSWDRIVKEYLRKSSPHEKKRAEISPFARLFDSFVEFDQAKLVADDEAVMTKWEAEFLRHIQRLREGLKTLNVTGPRVPRKKRFPGGAQFAGDLFQLLQTPGEYAQAVVEDAARRALAYEIDVAGASADEPSAATVQDFKSRFMKHVEAEKRQGHPIGHPIWKTAAVRAAGEVSAAGVR